METFYSKQLPPQVRIGESWEICDRPEDQSIVINGDLAGKNLEWLMAQYHDEILGSVHDLKGRFPLLVKILDCTQDLSIQIHPDEETGKKLGGESKTEMWRITHVEPGSHIYAGFKRGVVSNDFELALRQGDGKKIAAMLNQPIVRETDTILIPARGIHALGKGILTFEVQQNSDTTYRAYDWGRQNSSKGKPRELHIAQALECMDYQYVEPPLVSSTYFACERILVSCDYFSCLEHCQAQDGELTLETKNVPVILGVIKGRVVLNGQFVLKAGDFAMIPASLERVTLTLKSGATYLQIRGR